MGCYHISHMPYDICHMTYIVLTPLAAKSSASLRSCLFPTRLPLIVRPLRITWAIGRGTLPDGIPTNTMVPVDGWWDGGMVGWWGGGVVGWWGGGVVGWWVIVGLGYNCG
jgi:hypothetical protein